MPTLTLHPTSTYTHLCLNVLTLNNRGMHTTVVDLQNILTNLPIPYIIALTEIKYRHIKSIWRYALRNYKLVYNPSLYDKHTKRCSGGTILSIHKNVYPLEDFSWTSHTLRKGAASAANAIGARLTDICYVVG